MPVTLVTGFLEGGKTTAVRSILERGFGGLSGRTIVIDCEEEGIEAYHPEVLEKRNAVLIHLDGPFALNEAYFKIMEESYHPSQVFIEYGGMFRVSYLDGIRLPDRWKIVRQLSVFDGGVFAVYLQNLKPNIEDMIKYSNLIMFNRCEDQPGKGDASDRAAWKKYLLGVNPKAEIIYTDNKGILLP